MNLLAKDDAVSRLDEIYLTSDAFIKYISKSNMISFNHAEFSPCGQLVALSLRSGQILLMDFFTVGIVRLFCLFEEYGKPANEDVDQFFPFFRV